MKKTINNLAKAFIGESQARNRYSFFAKAAKKEGYEQIAAIFLLTAENEKEHASQIFKMINKIRENLEEVEILSPAPLKIGTTAENLKSAINGENHEYTEMYPEFSKTAKEEGLNEIADQLAAIGKAEMHHEERFKKLLKEVEEGTVFKKDEEVEWVCRECGYVHTGTEAPEKCPSCNHAKSFYEIKCEKY